MNKEELTDFLVWYNSDYLDDISDEDKEEFSRTANHYLNTIAPLHKQLDYQDVENIVMDAIIRNIKVEYTGKKFIINGGQDIAKHVFGKLFETITK